MSNSRYIVRITENDNKLSRIVYVDSLKLAKKCCRIIYEYRKMIHRPFIDVHVYDTQEWSLKYMKIWRKGEKR